MINRTFRERPSGRTGRRMRYEPVEPSARIPAAGRYGRGRPDLQDGLAMAVRAVPHPTRWEELGALAEIGSIAKKW